MGLWCNSVYFLCVPTSVNQTRAPSSSASESGAVAVGSAASSGAAASVKDIPVSSKGTDSRTALLCAMKPYLSEDRRNAVDYIVKLSRLGEILKTL